ncbi:hypothetical protein A0J51_02898 [Gluconobacter japonicus]|nr:hypothetical protein A0J51_02898 [Gluconobacter japonicus]
MTSDPFFLQPGLNQEIRPGKDGSDGSFTCSCCGLPSPGAGLSWTGPSSGAGLRVCQVCNLLQDTSRAAIDAEAMLVWWPEVSQSRLMFLARTAHQTLRLMARQQGQSDSQFWNTVLKAIPDPLLGTQFSPSFRTPMTLLRLLESRRAEAEHRLQSGSIRQITTAMRLCGSADKAVQRNLALLRAGLRILPTGRLLDAGADVYPAFLDKALALTPS